MKAKAFRDHHIKEQSQRPVTLETIYGEHNEKEKFKTNILFYSYYFFDVLFVMGIVVAFMGGECCCILVIEK